MIFDERFVTFIHSFSNPKTLYYPCLALFMCFYWLFQVNWWFKSLLPFEVEVLICLYLLLVITVAILCQIYNHLFSAEHETEHLTREEEKTEYSSPDESKETTTTSKKNYVRKVERVEEEGEEEEVEREETTPSTSLKQKEVEEVKKEEEEEVISTRPNRRRMRRRGSDPSLVKIPVRMNHFFSTYKLIKPLGGGASSNVYDAVHIQSGTRRAIKVLRIDEKATDKEYFRGKLDLEKVLKFLENAKLCEAKADSFKGRRSSHPCTTSDIPSSLEDLEEITNEVCYAFCTELGMKKEISRLERLDGQDRAGWTVRLFDYWREENFHFLVFERCQGDFVKEVMLRLDEPTDPNRPCDRTLYRYAYDITRAFQYLEENGIKHLDFKAANLFLSKNSRYGGMDVIVGDFGIATSTSVEKDNPHVLGLLHILFYGSGEVYEGLRKLMITTYTKHLEDRRRRSYEVSETHYLLELLEKGIKELCPACVMSEGCVEYVDLKIAEVKSEFEEKLGIIMEELNMVKEELNETKKELNMVKEELDEIKST